MSLLTKIPIQSTLKKRRIPNAFMLFVKDQKDKLVRKCPEESMTVIGTFLSKKWKSLGVDEKQVYYDKYNAMKKRYEVLSSKKSEDSMDNDVIKEVNEITKISEIKLDPKQGKSTNMKKTDDFSDVTTELESQPNSKKYKTRLKSNTNDSISPSKSKDSKKKHHILKNPFLIFAKEQRRNIRSTKKSHVSTILGNMWQDLEYSEKKKYFEKARKPYPVRKEAKSSVLSSEGKSRNKTKKKREAKSNARAFLIEKDAATSKDTAGIKDKSEKKENLVNNAFTESSGADSQHPGTTCHQPDRMPCHHGSASHYQQSICNSPKAAPTDLNTPAMYSANLGGFYRPYLGAGFPGLYPSDSAFASMPLWVYQQSMIPHYYPYSTSYQSHCHCSMPYGYPPGASHFRSFIYGRPNATYPNTPQNTASCNIGGNSSNGCDVRVLSVRSLASCSSEGNPSNACDVRNHVNAQDDNNHDDDSDDDRLVIVDDMQVEQPDNTESGE